MNNYLEEAMASMSVFYQNPMWLIAVQVLALLLTSEELGFRLGLRRRHSHGDTDVETGGGGIMITSLFALMALILAFTYSAAVNRHEARKQAVIVEANALGTAYLRADMLQQPARDQVKRVLYDYALTRVRQRAPDAGSAPSLKERAQALRETFEAQSRIWPTLRRAVLTPPDGEARLGPAEVSVVTAINDVLDIHTTRITALFDKLPPVVIWMLLAIATASLGVTGYNAGIQGRLCRWRLGIFAAVLTGVMIVVLDYDRPVEGMVRTDQASLHTLIHDMRLDLGIEPVLAK